MSNQYADLRFVVSSRSSYNAPPQGVWEVLECALAVHCKKDYIGVTMCPILTLICYHCQGIEQCEIIFHHILTKLHSFMGNVENVL